MKSDPSGLVTNKIQSRDSGPARRSVHGSRWCLYRFLSMRAPERANGGRALRIDPSLHRARSGIIHEILRSIASQICSCPNFIVELRPGCIEQMCC